MITIYHAVRPSIPQAVCCAHLGLWDPLVSEWNWRASPLWVAGQDSSGGTVCCLAHGRYRGLYQRALNGIAALFQLTVRWVDTDDIVWQELERNRATFLTLLLYNYFPKMAGKPVRRSVERWIGQQVLKQ